MFKRAYCTELKWEQTVEKSASNTKSQEEKSWPEICARFNIDPKWEGAEATINQYVEAGWIKAVKGPKRKVAKLMEKGWCKAATSTYFIPTRKLETSSIKNESKSETRRVEVPTQQAAEGGA